MKVLVVIPARYASSRFPGKPLALLKGADGRALTLIERTWNTAQNISAVSSVVATDDDRIATEVRRFGGEVKMTPSSCKNGTERCAAVLDKLGDTFDLVVNLQGDAPLTPPWFVDDLISAMAGDEKIEVATPILACSPEMLSALRGDRLAGRVGATTVVRDRLGNALYFSKEVLPFGADAQTRAFHHVGVYAYRPTALGLYSDWSEAPLERVEGLEQLRFLENGMPIRCVEVDAKTRSFWELNNPEDVSKIETMMKKMGVN